MVMSTVLIQYEQGVKEYEEALAAGTVETSRPVTDYTVTARAYIRNLLEEEPSFDHDDGLDTFPALLRWLERVPDFESALCDLLALARLRAYEHDTMRKRFVERRPTVSSPNTK